jgi:23S rRNA pseudouridine1911/1915/1917 synthase
MRLDAHLAQKFPEHSRATWQKLIRRGDVMVAGQAVTEPKTDVADDAVIKVNLPSDQPPPQDLPTIYEDDNVVVINKPVGVLTHSKGALNDEFTVATFVRARAEQGGEAVPAGDNRFGIVHRLDRATSGVLITAKNAATRAKLQHEFSERRAKKSYFAITERAPKESRACIDLPIGRNPKHPSQFRVDAIGKPAITYYEVKKVLPDGRALIELKPQTGRTHQLRVHLAYVGAPIVGDSVYGSGAHGDRMMLHASELEITIPNGQRKTFVAPLPPDFIKALQ